MRRLAFIVFLVFFGANNLFANQENLFRYSSEESKANGVEVKIFNIIQKLQDAQNQNNAKLELHYQQKLKKLAKQFDELKIELPQNIF